MISSSPSPSTSRKKKTRPKQTSSHHHHHLAHSLELERLLPSSKPDFSRLIAVLSLAAVFSLACHFIATSFLNHPPPPKPFCDTSVSDSLDDDDPLSDYCVPCPANGVCYGGELKCIHGYRKHGKLCVEDGNFNEAAKKLSKWVEVRVCEAYVQFLCNGTGKCWISENELFNNIGNEMMDSYPLVEAIYMPAKERAMEFVQKSLETRRNNEGVEEYKCPEQLVSHYKPLSCKVRLWIIKHAVLLIPASASFLGCMLLVSRVYKGHRLSVRAEQLYHEACDVLEEKMLMSRRENGGSEPWVVDSWLRDHLLSPKERKDRLLWKKVEGLVAEDSRVDQYPKIVKGESKVVWEWQVEGALSSSGKKKKRDRTEKVKESISDGSIPKLKEFFQGSKVQGWMHAG